ncbi:hypothetical protein MASR2M48_21280 [Spirochaetota bacterium]
MAKAKGDIEARLVSYFREEIKAAAFSLPSPPRLPRSSAWLNNMQHPASSTKRGYGDILSSLAMAACLLVCATLALPGSANGQLARSMVQAQESGSLSELGRELKASAVKIWETGHTQYVGQ